MRIRHKVSIKRDAWLWFSRIPGSDCFHNEAHPINILRGGFVLYRLGNIDVWRTYTDNTLWGFYEEGKHV